MTAHKIFKRFIKRLRRLRQKNISKNLSKLNSRNDLNKTFDYPDATKIQKKIIHSLREKIEKIFSHIYKLMKMPCEGLIYFFKRKNGRYRLYLEKKDKLEDNLMQILPNSHNVVINVTTEEGLSALKEEETYKNIIDDNNENRQLVFSIIKNPNSIIQELENDEIKMDANMVKPLKALMVPYEYFVKNGNLSFTYIPSRYAKASQDRPLVFRLKPDTRGPLSKGVLKQSSSFTPLDRGAIF